MVGDISHPHWGHTGPEARVAASWGKPYSVLTSWIHIPTLLLPTVVNRELEVTRVQALGLFGDVIGIRKWQFGSGIQILVSPGHSCLLRIKKGRSQEHGSCENPNRGIHVHIPPTCHRAQANMCTNPCSQAPSGHMRTHGHVCDSTSNCIPLSCTDTSTHPGLNSWT